MIIYDTETTGLVLPGLVPLKDQPQIIEFAGIKLDDDTLEEVERLDFLVQPGCQLPEEIVKITHITDEMLAGQKPFAAHYADLCSFFLGETTLVAHNLMFDLSLLRFELERIGKQFAFPYPYKQVCTVEASFSLYNKRLHLGELHLCATGTNFKDAHRAMSDTEALVRCVRWLKEKELM
jgi:DNA polymerase-3 subunit alpha (Gram-positive type)